MLHCSDTDWIEGDLRPRRGATSVVWMRFGYEKSRKNILCRICRQPVH